MKVTTLTVPQQKMIATIGCAGAFGYMEQMEDRKGRKLLMLDGLIDTGLAERFYGPSRMRQRVRLTPRGHVWFTTITGNVY